VAGFERQEAEAQEREAAMPREPYADPLVYDVLHDPGTRDEVEVILGLETKLLKGKRGAGEGLLLEPACGSGRLVRALAARGRVCAGFDLSTPMVEWARVEARKRGVARRAKFFVADMRDFDCGTAAAAAGVGPGSVRLAFNLINTIRHVPDDRGMLGHFAAVSRVLMPGGVYLVGVSLNAYGLEQPTEDVWSGKRRGLRVDQVVQYLPPTGRRGEGARAERVISHLTVRRKGRGGEVVEHRDETYVLRGYDLTQWRALVGKSALREVGVFDGAGLKKMPTGAGYVIFALARTG
jgi:SAM-dependent methyltransferase